MSIKHGELEFTLEELSVLKALVSLERADCHSRIFAGDATLWDRNAILNRLFIELGRCEYKLKTSSKE